MLCCVQAVQGAWCRHHLRRDGAGDQPAAGEVVRCTWYWASSGRGSADSYSCFLGSQQGAVLGGVGPPHPPVLPFPRAIRPSCLPATWRQGKTVLCAGATAPLPQCMWCRSIYAVCHSILCLVYWSRVRLPSGRSSSDTHQRTASGFRWERLGCSSGALMKPATPLPAPWRMQNNCRHRLSVCLEFRVLQPGGQ